MNSDLIPSSRVSDSDSQQPPIETVAEENPASRQQPIPPPSEPMQYRAIGLVRGRYQASTEQFTQGTLLAHDGTQLQAVLLGRIISLVRKHIDLEAEHLWVVYPRTGQKDNQLHLQIVGVWEPETLAKQPNPEDTTTGEAAPSEADSAPIDNAEDGYFSVRGEVVFQSAGDSRLVVKIKQAPRKESDRPKFFKVNLQGVLKTKAVGQFWEFHVLRQAEDLVVQEGKSIATLPKPFRKPMKKPFGARSGGGYNKGDSRGKFETPRPVRKPDGSMPMPQKPIPKAPVPKPTKRPKPPQE